MDTNQIFLSSAFIANKYVKKPLSGQIRRAKIISMISEYTHNKITWIDLENPTADEARGLAEKYSIDPLVANELLSPTTRPRVDYHGNYIYLILHFPVNHNASDNGPSTAMEEVDFIIGKDFIITVRYGVVDALLEFSKTFEVKSILQDNKSYDHAGYIFFHMVRHLYRGLDNRLETIHDSLMEVERKIFSGKEKKMVLEISRINRLLLNYKQSTDLHNEILESFKVAGQDMFGKEYEYHAHGIIGEYYKVRSEMNSAKEYLDELRSTNDSLLTTKQNQIMTVLTSITFIVLPLSLVASIFGMNTTNTPIVGHSEDFLIILAFMLALAAVTFILFRFKKWL
jgi:magnesium transporter